MNNETSRTHITAEDLKGAWADYEKATAPALVVALTHDSVETAP